MAIIAHEKGRICSECGFGNSQRSNKCAVCGHGLSKYRNVKIRLDGFVFDSRKEATRYEELRLAQKAGKIEDLRVHPRYLILVNNMKICTYEADFEYTDRKAIIVEDTKGIKTRIYAIKKKLMLAVKGISIQEV